MTVVRGDIASKSFTSVDGIQGFVSTLSPPVIELVMQSLAINSTADESKDSLGKKIFIGAETEVALLGFVSQMNGDYKLIRSVRPVLGVGVSPASSHTPFFPVESHCEPVPILLAAQEDEHHHQGSGWTVSTLLQGSCRDRAELLCVWDQRQGRGVPHGGDPEGLL